MANNQIANVTKERNITDVVLNRVKELEGNGEISFPVNYSYQNALKSAYLVLQETKDKNKNPALEVCTKTSVVNALLDMVIQGLSVAKKQCYFVVYGKQLQLVKSYLGNVAVTKRLHGVKNVFANVIYEKDEFSYKMDLETGLKKITKHEQSFENIDTDKIKGAYAVVVMEDGNNYVEVMTMKQIRTSWNQGYAKGNSDAHKNFTDEMCKKTVINRACKNFVCTSDDSDILIESINRTNENTGEINAKFEVKEEIKENANTTPIQISKPEPAKDDIEKVTAEKVSEPQQQSFIEENDEVPY